MQAPQFKKPYKSISRRSFIAVVLSLFLVLGALEALGRTETLSRAALAAAAPFWSSYAGLALKAEEAELAWKDKKTLLVEKKLLEKELAAIEAEALLYRHALKENEELKAILGNAEESGTRLTAAVLTKPSRSPYDTLIAGIGTGGGIAKQGDLVLARGHIAIGRIETLSGQTARVKLFSSPGEEIDVTLGDEHVQAVARGRGGGNFAARLPRGVDVKEGDEVSFPAISTRIVGVVERVEALPTDSFQTVLFKIPINVFELKWVEILTS